MKFPSQPPNSESSFNSLFSSEKYASFLKLSQKLALDVESYYHWDEFRHRCEKVGPLSKTEQWAALKFSRMAGKQLLPFQDVKGLPFSFSLTQRTFKSLHEIDLHCGGGLALPDEITNRDTRDRYYITSLIEESLTSSQIEGAVVTRAEARDMIRNNRKPISNDELMVLNNFETMQKMADWQKQKLTPELILDMHRSLTFGTMENENRVGMFRTNDEISVIDEESNEVFHKPPPALEVPTQIQALCDFANETEMKGFLHPAIRAIAVHFWLAYLHPFHDGNGRTARALFYWTMLKNGFWLFEFISISHEIKKAPKKYYRAFLHTETDEADLNYFIHHQLGVTMKAIEALLQYIDKKRADFREVEKLLGASSTYNYRQLALLRHALKHSAAQYSVKSHQNSHGISNQTARTDLQKLAQDKLLEVSRASRTVVFYPSATLSDQIAARY